MQDAYSPLRPRLLAEQSAAQARALAAAQRAGGLAQKRYRAGFVAYFEVIEAQRTVLAAERASTQLAAQRLTNRVALIEALGGGWSGTVPAFRIFSRYFQRLQGLSPAVPDSLYRSET